MTEQSVPGYDPQLVARLSLSHATIVYCTARGSRLNRDVEPKTIERLREIATAAATTIKIHLAGAYESPVTAKT